MTDKNLLVITPHIRQRQAEGIAVAKARGVRFGRAEKPIPPEFYEIWSQRKRKEINTRDAEKC